MSPADWREAELSRQLLAEATGRPPTHIARQWEQGRLLTAQEAVREGLVDEAGG